MNKFKSKKLEIKKLKKKKSSPENEGSFWRVPGMQDEELTSQP